MKVYTKTGDLGETSLYGGTRVRKNDIRVEAYGTTDELMAHIGLLMDLSSKHHYKNLFKEVLDRLFTLGSHLAASPDKTKLKKPDFFERDVYFIENEIDTIEEQLEPLSYFVLPGGHVHVSHIHIARTVCRRAEREVVRLAEVEEINPLFIQYLNRLSDFLFVYSRLIAKELEVQENFWIPRK